MFGKGKVEVGWGYIYSRACISMGGSGFERQVNVKERNVRGVYV